MLTVFLTSTSKDLTSYREAAYRAIEGLHGYHCVRMEDFGSWDGAPDEFCRSKVAECDLFVCMVGPLYGSRTQAGKSFREREFEAAIENSKPCLVFVTADDFPLAANLIEPDDQRQRQIAFREKVSQARMITRFSTPQDISLKMVQAIRNWEASQATAALPTQASLLASQINRVSCRVAVLNESTTVHDEAVQAAVVALQKQVHCDFAPVWGIDAELAFVRKGANPAPGSWWLAVCDDVDYPNVVAYHSLTLEGLPYVKISVPNARQANWEWTMAASHDLLEMLANPRLNLTIFVPDDRQLSGRLHVREICDPVSSSEYAYKIDGVTVSDFVYPAWFESFRKAGRTQFDFGGHLSRPFEVAPGACSTVFDVKSGSGWHAVFGGEPPSNTDEKAAAKNKPDSRKRVARN